MATILCVALAAALASSAVATNPATCGADMIMPGIGLGGDKGLVAEESVATMGDCCALCHGNYHDECVAWIWGQTGSHNCAIMSQLNHARNVSNHTSGVVPGAHPSPPPSPSGQSGPACNADTSCELNGEFWRCAHAEAPATNATNNCHLPGPGTAGNATCACFRPACADTHLPIRNGSTTQYLCIGDSISLGMETDLRGILATKDWALTHSPGNAASSNLGAHCLSGWVGADKFKWDVISYQFGLHDLGYDTERISVEQYTQLMANITAELAAVQKKDGTKIVWVTTTPVPTVPVYDQTDCNETAKCLNPPRYDADAVLYNAAAAKVVAAANAAGATIVIADLYTFVLAKCGGTGYKTCDGFQLPANVHYTAVGWEAIATEFSGMLLKAFMDEL